jgi:hypothetical protein
MTPASFAPGLYSGRDETFCARIDTAIPVRVRPTKRLKAQLEDR